jgi:hypothetical protein
MSSICARVGKFLLLKSVQSATLNGTAPKLAEAAVHRLFAFAKSLLDVRPVAGVAERPFVVESCLLHHNRLHGVLFQPATAGVLELI